MMSLPYSASTKLVINQLREHLPHALLLTGERGVGLEQAACDIAGGQLAEIVHPTAADGIIDETKGVIRIEQIRSLYEATRGSSRQRRVFIIVMADKMGEPAQNALLKLLEEPTPQVHFILTSHNIAMLLPTILSRVQKTQVHSIGNQESTQLLRSHGITDESLLTQLLFLASGKPALLNELATNSDLRSEKIKCMADARAFLQGATTEKLQVVHEYGADRTQALNLTEAALSIVDHSLRHKPTPALIRLADLLVVAHERIAANGSAKLQLMLIVV